MIFLIDANSFYASCEALFRPDLDGKPIAVLSNNDGITIALNQECKKLGFQRGDNYFKMKGLYESKGVAVFSSNYTLYADMSSRLNLLYSSFCPEVEIYSIDESFLFFPDWKKADFTQMGIEIRSAVTQSTHIPVSVGIAPTKTLAKLCNKLAKKRGGVCNWQEIDTEAELAAYAVQDIWGIGHAKSKLLARHGIQTALQLKNLKLDTAKQLLTITGMNTVQELNGICAIETPEAERRKNITSSRSFARGVNALTELETALAEYTQLAVERLRREGSVCRLISVYLTTGRSCMANEGDGYSNALTAALLQESDFLPDILTAAIKLLRKLYRPGYSYKKILVNLSGLESAAGRQGALFEEEQSISKEKKQALMAACDSINSKFGHGCLHTGIRNQTPDRQKEGAAAGQSAAWIMKRQMLSPEYTTKLADIPTVGCEAYR